MNYNILILAAMLRDNDPEGNAPFVDNVSFFVDYAVALTNAGLTFTAMPDQIVKFDELYPELTGLTIAELLSYS